MTRSKTIISSLCVIRSCRPGSAGAISGTLLVLAAVTALEGCFPYFVRAGPKEGSRTNIPADVPSWIVSGQTTRRDILFTFGEPDAADVNGRWFSYGSAIGQGGVGGALFLVGIRGSTAGGYASRQPIEYRHLIVYFGETGLVEDTKFETRTCTSWRRGGDLAPDFRTGRSYESPACLNIRTGELSKE